MRIRVFTAAMALIAIGGACSTDDGTDRLEPGPTVIATEAPAVIATETPSATPPVACAENACDVIAVEFDVPLSLEQVLDLAVTSRTAVVALWRTDPICVTKVGSPPATTPGGDREASQFAYVDADHLRRVQDDAPPATDGGWSLAIRDRFVEEWRAATDPGVRFAGAALLTFLPEVDHPMVSSQSAVEWYLTDQTDVLYLRRHEAALEAFFGVAQDGC